MRHILTLLILVFFCFETEAQSYNFYPHYSKMYKISAVSGLNLRSKPNLQSDIIQKVAFGEKVRLEHKDAYGYAAIDSIITESNQKYVSKGFWIKVNYNGLVGFMNTAYLYPIDQTFQTEKMQTKLNEDYVLLLPGFGCRDNLIDGFDQFNWYGLYREDAGVFLRKIAFEYCRSDGEMSDLSVVAKKDKNLTYIIGSKRALQEGSINEQMINQQFYKDEEVSDTLERISFENEYCQVKTKGYYQTWKTDKGVQERFYKTYKVFAFLDGQTQLLSEEGYINWVGDIDQDGYMDYIATKGEKNARTYLYLSSEREQGQIAKPVGVFYSGYCC